MQLPTGLAMEVLSAGPATTAPSLAQNSFESIIAGLFQSTAAAAATNKKPPLVFVHGSFHSAWCWAEHFLPFFAAQVSFCLGDGRLKDWKRIEGQVFWNHSSLLNHPPCTPFTNNRATSATPSAAVAPLALQTPTQPPWPSRYGHTPPI